MAVPEAEPGLRPGAVAARALGAVGSGLRLSPFSSAGVEAVLRGLHGGAGGGGVLGREGEELGSGGVGSPDKGAASGEGGEDGTG